MTPGLSIVVPTLDEATCLPALLDDLAGLDDELHADVVVADGGSTDATREIARSAGVRVVTAPLGRATQLRAGAEATRGEWLFFVHADSRLTERARSALLDFLTSASPDDFAHFRFALRGSRTAYRVIELGQRLREWALGLPYGDQGLVVSRAAYERVGGYPAWPILEDVEIIRRLSRSGRRHVLPATLPTSARRYAAEGSGLGTFRHVTVMVKYLLGGDPNEIAARYPRPAVRPAAELPSDTVIVFAKAPRPGQVKTRLAADIGPEAAARLYRRLGSRTIAAVSGGRARVVVYHDPPDDDAEAEVRRWLGEGPEYRAQTGGDLGRRMADAIEECCLTSDRVCVIGTDVPDLGSSVSDAFRALDGADVVIGPATDGGYYLIATRRPIPELFDDVPWSTDAVLRRTLERAEALDLRVTLLDARTDVDTWQDVPEGLRAALGPGSKL